MSQTFASGELKVEVQGDAGGVRVTWLGRSTARDPGAFLAPVLSDAYKRANAEKRALTMDFIKLEYMNSSTITPVIRLLHEAKKGGGRITILYDSKSKWQDLSFSALTIFQTEDKRIEIKGV